MERSGAVPFSDQIDILGQQPLAKVYSPLIFCFPMPDDENASAAVLDVLKGGLKRLSTHFPWVAGQLVNEGARPGNSGTFKIARLDATPRLTIKDLRHRPSLALDSLQKAQFPVSALDEMVLAPCKTLQTSASELLPLLVLQANLVSGGLLLTIAGQHNAMDMIAQGCIIHLLSKACNNQPFTDDEVKIGNIPRHGIIPLLESYPGPGPELAFQIGQPLESHDSTDVIVRPSPPLTGGYSWALFTFSPASLARLKAFTTASLQAPTAFISTDDALSALIWQSILRARSHRFTKPKASSTQRKQQQEVTLCRAVDVRSYLKLPKTYLGFMQTATYHTFSSVDELFVASLGSIASQLRSAIEPPTQIVHNTRAYATVLDRSPDKSCYSLLIGLDLTVDILITSWAKLNSYSLDFGFGLGTPLAVRRPMFPPVEGLVFLLPKSQEGDIGVQVCLRTEDMERLKSDDLFGEYAVFVG